MHDRRDGHHAGFRSQPNRGQIPSRSGTLPAAAHCAISIATPVRPRRYGVPRPVCLLKADLLPSLRASARGHLLRENPWLQLQHGGRVCFRALSRPSVKSVTVPIMAPCSRCNISLVPFEGPQFGLTPRLARCKSVRDRGGAFSKQSILRSPARPAERECSAGYFL